MAARRTLLLAALVVAGTLLLALNLPAATSASLTDGAREGAISGYHSVRNRVLGPPRVGIQIGHLEAASHPQELASLRVSTGGVGNGVFEVDVNRMIAEALASRLQSRGISVELLPATVPAGYRADLVISIHADSSKDPHRRGYKSAIYREDRNHWDSRLKRIVDSWYLRGSGLPDDHRNVTGDMLEYYAFNRAYRHSLARGTPALIVEVGYLSHAQDMRLLARPDRVAELLQNGIMEFLIERGRVAAGDQKLAVAEIEPAATDIVPVPAR